MPRRVAQVDFLAGGGVCDDHDGPRPEPHLEDGPILAGPARVGLDLAQPLELEGVADKGGGGRARDVAEAEAGEGVEGPEEELDGVWVVGKGGGVGGWEGGGAEDGERKVREKGRRGEQKERVERGRQIIKAGSLLCHRCCREALDQCPPSCQSNLSNKDWSLIASPRSSGSSSSVRIQSE